MNLALVYIMNGQTTEAENAINCVVAFCQDSGAWCAGIPAQVFLGAVLIAKGQMELGLKRLKEGKQQLLSSGNMLDYLSCEYILGKVFSQIAQGTETINLSKIVKNIGDNKCATPISLDILGYTQLCRFIPSTFLP